MIITEAELRVLLGLDGDDMTLKEQTTLQTIHGEAESAIKRYLHYNPEQGTRVEFLPRHLPVGGTGMRGTRWDVNSSHAFITYPTGGRNVGMTLQLTHLPVRRIDSIRISTNGKFGQTNDLLDQVDENNDPVANAFEQDAGDDFWPQYEQPNLCRTGIIHSSKRWPITVGSVRVEYVGGYSDTEFSGRADAQSANADTARGLITVADVSAADIKRAVTLTVTAAMHTQNSYEKNGERGFDGGTGFESEKLQDYSYKRPEAANVQITGMQVAIPDEAKELLGPYRS
jgi:predicted ThiF/HesA family dinucleotide-utilizing enzyme